MSGMSSDGEDNILQDESDDGSDGDGMFGYNFLSYPTSILTYIRCGRLWV